MCLHKLNFSFEFPKLVAVKRSLTSFNHAKHTPLSFPRTNSQAQTLVTPNIDKRTSLHF